MPTFSELASKNQTLIRKGLEGAIFVKRYDDGDAPIVSLKDGSGLLALPTGYEDVGYVTKDQGANWTRNVETSDVNSLGAAEPTRRDITTDQTGLAFTAQESKALTMGLLDGVDLSAATFSTTGNVSYDKPDRPASVYYRVLALFKDGEGVDAVYFAKWLPRAQVTEPGEQSWNEENEVQYPLTFTAFVDPVAGTSIRSMWAGPTATLTAMGFTAAP